MRQMRNKSTGSVLTVTEHIITKNFWEYYLTNEETDDPMVKFGFVMGFENELGYIYIPEISPYVLTRTNNLTEVMPATGYEWVE
jgi:hypothetical protein